MRAWISITLTVSVLAMMGLGFTVAFRATTGFDLLRSDTEPPVLLIVVGSIDNVERVREAMPDDQIVHESAGAFALAGGRIVTNRVENASLAVNEVGWGDRELEILSPRHLLPRNTAPLDPHTNPSDGGASLSQLSRKPALTAGEAIRALRMLR